MTELERYKIALDRAVNHILNLINKGLLCTGPAKDAAQLLREIASHLNPPPEFEEVEVEHWKGYDEKGRLRYDGPNEPQEWSTFWPLVKLTGTIRRQKPQPVEGSVSVEAVIQSGRGAGHPVPNPHSCRNLFSDFPECYGKSGTLTFTWTEEP